MTDTTNFSLKRRQLLTLLAASPLLAALPRLSFAETTQTAPWRLAGPFASVSFPLIHMATATPQQAQFTNWRSPDQLRAITSQHGADFTAVPSNLAANLYNHNIPVRLVSVPTWGILWLMTVDQKRQRLEDFAGEEIVVFFRGDTPDIILQVLFKKAGMEVGKDVKLQYVPTPMDAGQQLVTRKAQHALLTEPMVSMLLEKINQLPARLIAPNLYPAVNIQQEWGRLFQREPRLPQAGIMALGEKLIADDAALNTFHGELMRAQDWVFSHPKDAAKEVVAKIDMLTPTAVEAALQRISKLCMSAGEARAELEFMYQEIAAIEPKLIGDKIPADNFYFTAS